MKLYVFALIAILAVLAQGAKEQKHKFITLDNMNPTQLVSLMKGDWKAMLPDTIKNLMGVGAKAEP